MATTNTETKPQPACLAGMGCLCWAHAIGAPADAVCFTGELAPFGEEVTAVHHRLRAEYERAQADALHGDEHMVQQHRVTAAAHERSAIKLEGGYVVPAWGGFKLPDETKLAYGARAIYALGSERVPHGKGFRDRTTASLDIPYDRQELNGGSPAERKAFATWINKAGIPAIKKKLVEQYVTRDSEDVVTFASDGYSIIAGPKASFGYVYINAWKVQS